MTVDSEYNLQRVGLKEEMHILDGEISKLQLQIAALSDELRWKRIKRQNIQRELSKSH